MEETPHLTRNLIEIEIGSKSVWVQDQEQGQDQDIEGDRNKISEILPVPESGGADLGGHRLSRPNVGITMLIVKSTVGSGDLVDADVKCWTMRGGAD